MLNICKWVRKMMPGCACEEKEEFRMSEYIKECIERALTNQETSENIKYKGVPYNFKDAIDKSEIEFTYDWTEGGIVVAMRNSKEGEIARINMHLMYEGSYRKKGEMPHTAHIHRLCVKEKYRRRGYAAHLICISLFIADMLDAKQISVNNTCEYRELYTLFMYRSNVIREY